MSRIKNPFFILGNPRSGTTLLRLMLDVHPDISVPPECGFIIWFNDKYKLWSKCDNNHKKIQEFVDDLKKAKKISSWNLDFKFLTDYLYSISPSNYKELVTGVYTFFASSNNKTIKFWGDKNNYYLNHIKELTAIFPEARFIHIIRDGRDVACSYKELNKKIINSQYAPKLSDNIVEIAHEWKTNNELIIRDLEKYSNQELYISTKFESLIRESEKELKRQCKFLNVKYNHQMLEYYNYSKTYEPEEFLQWKADTLKPPQVSRIGRYLDDLTYDEIYTFNQEAGSVLKRFEYEI